MSENAAPTTGLDRQADAAIPRKRVLAWALWDWGTQPLNTVLITFVFAASYLTSEHFIDPAVAALGPDDPAYGRALAELAANYGYAGFIAGIAVLLLAPVIGQRADVSGRRKRWLGWSTLALVLLQFGLFFVSADPAYFWFGAILIGLMQVVQDIAGVNYNAMLVSVSTPRTVGKVSGLGWGMGYVGGIVALGAVIVAGAFNFWGMPTDDGLGYRVIAVFCAVWTVVFALPLFLEVPETPPAQDRPQVGFFRSYVIVAKDVVGLWREARPTFWFLVASAIYRDGLTGVFTYGAIIAAQAFFFPETSVQAFGLVALFVAGAAAFVAGFVDDRFGSRAVVVVSLTGMVVAGVVIVVLHPLGPVVFWAAGLFLCLFVGPAQASSRSFLARITPAGRESEVFGLYATTGRAASFLTPLLWGLVVQLTGAIIWGTLAVLFVVLVGLAMLALVREPSRAPA
ncbi:MFS transporter [Myceligenerans pegani]|uniref:MFS transporter n=1 Tax=Myceligenerans pegani TaxID=2776917 RepID=A0ABR9MVC7_9MICO|nr:MFS transporter [Myceligenerans sp. TRM 65318]MBE1874991.1 MFS transporter [Myceligenerans sp. TRM 65318]MBE3017262.1 MFS transporter [Myceligenerans sp. TRM 65318]